MTSSVVSIIFVWIFMEYSMICNTCSLITLCFNDFHDLESQGLATLASGAGDFSARHCRKRRTFGISGAGDFSGISGLATLAPDIAVAFRKLTTMGRAKDIRGNGETMHSQSTGHLTRKQIYARWTSMTINIEKINCHQGKECPDLETTQSQL